MEPRQTLIEARIKIGERKFGLCYIDQLDYNRYPGQAMTRRFEMMRDFSKALERTIVKELGLSLEAYLLWRNRHV